MFHNGEVNPSRQNGLRRNGTAVKRSAAKSPSSPITNCKNYNHVFYNIKTVQLHYIIDKCVLWCHSGNSPHTRTLRCIYNILLYLKLNRPQENPMHAAITLRVTRSLKYYYYCVSTVPIVISYGAVDVLLLACCMYLGFPIFWHRLDSR